MSESPTNSIPLSILHPTDFSEDSMHAFCHALKVAVEYQANLTVLHVEKNDSDEHWSDFPGVRETLQRWGLINADAPRSAVWDQLAVSVNKVDATGPVIPSIINYLDSHQFDVMILATQGREGLPGWLHRSVAEPLARKAMLPTLFVPHGAKGFVDLETGDLRMQKLLMPIDHDPSPRYALADALEVLESLGNDDSELVLFHNGDEMPEVNLPETFKWNYEKKIGSGRVVESIVQAASDVDADMILMVTAGQQGFLDVVRGSTSERVLHHAPCPVLTVPGASDAR